MTVRLRDRATGSIVSVDDEFAARLGAGYEPADDTKAEPKGSTPDQKPATVRRAPAAKK